MRISSISIAQPMQHNYKMKTKNTNVRMQQVQQMPQTSFKGLKAGFFGLVGTFVGGGAAVLLSGGALLPVLLASAAGTAGGCIYGSSKEGGSSDDDYGYSAYCPNINDF